MLLGGRGFSLSAYSYHLTHHTHQSPFCIFFITKRKVPFVLDISITSHTFKHSFAQSYSIFHTHSWIISAPYIISSANEFSFLPSALFRLSEILFLFLRQKQAIISCFPFHVFSHCFISVLINTLNSLISYCPLATLAFSVT